MNKQKKKIILVAEDQPSLMSALSDKLTQAGFEVIEAFNGEDCLVAVDKYNPDLILLDIVMPKMDGMTVLEKLKSDKDKKDIPIIMLTNLSSFEDIQKATEKGAHDYLVKTDWSLEDIVKKIKERLGMEK